LLRGAWSAAAAAVLCTAIVILAFDWSLIPVLIGAAGGLIFWGGLLYLLDIDDRVPDDEALPLAPLNATITTQWQPRRRYAFQLATLIALAWFAGHFDVGAAIIPGEFFGAATASLLGAHSVTLWERKHGGEVLARADRPDELYVARGDEVLG